MHKQELIHLHSLFLELARFCEAGDVSGPDLDPYRALGTTPLAIHQPKPRHAEAVSLLAAAITSAIEGADGTELAREPSESRAA